MKRLGLASIVGWMAVAGCTPAASPGSGFGDGGADSGVVVDGSADSGAALDVPTARDGGVAGDVLVKSPDVPEATDVPVVTDVPKPEDVPPGQDGGVIDVPPGSDVPVVEDASRIDDVPVSMDLPVLSDAPVAVDAPSVDPCLAPVNLNLVGTLAGSTTRYTGNNTLTAVSSTYSGTCGMSGHVQAFSYTPRTTTRLRISTDNAGTPATFDTVVFAQDRCVATGATSLGCHDDVNDGARVRASTFVTTAAVTAGTTIFLFVAGYEPPAGAYTSTGPFELTVLEVPTVPAGSACDPAGATSACAAGSSCRTTGSTSVCVADGAADAACRAAAPRCDATLECSASGVCVTAPGTNGGLCRATGAACDAGLACSPITDRCRAAVADGASCDPMGLTNACLAPAQCASGTCRRFWAESAIASPSFLDACASGTRVVLNGTSRDDTRALAAVTIPWTFSFFGAPQTQLWPSTNGFVQFGATAPSSPTAGSLPDEFMGPLVALFWDDLVLRASPGSDLCVATVGASPERRLVIEWLDAYRYGTMDSHITAEIILNESGNTIDLIYSRLEAPAASSAVVDGSRATIGLQNAAGALFIEHTGTVSTAAGIRFSSR